jgi:serine/threonine-protein kinase HipA
MKLDVHVRETKVASLYRERDEYVLKYLPDARETDFVSLTMPVREEPWRWPRDLHPFFRQNLPEGYLLGVIREEFGRYLDGTDLSLLAVVGGAGIGRVTVTPEGVAPGVELKPFQVEQLLTSDNTTERFADLVRQYARAAISGAVPKFLDPGAPLNRADEAAALGKSTLRTSRHIVKGSDERTEYLGFNEYYSMRVLSRLNVVPVASVRMSADGRVLIVDRFDIDDRGVVVAGVEDACSLLGLAPHEKYSPSMEKIEAATRVYLPEAIRRDQLQQLGWQILVNYVVRNADCHSKNIALSYTEQANVSYTPVYDIVTTQAYPRFADNSPGLSVGGRKTWAPGKSLEVFFKGRLGLSPREYKEMVERLCESAVETGKEVIAAAKENPAWRTIAKQMLHAWNEGMASLRSPRGEETFKQLTPHIESAGFSDPEPPESARVIGRSEGLAPRSKRRK